MIALLAESHIGYDFVYDGVWVSTFICVGVQDTYLCIQPAA